MASLLARYCNAADNIPWRGNQAPSQSCDTGWYITQAQVKIIKSTNYEVIQIQGIMSKTGCTNVISMTQSLIDLITDTLLFEIV